MLTLLALFATLVRLLKPAKGVHASAFGYFRELVSETSALRRRRASRVRRYARKIPTVAEYEPPTVPPIFPAPRKPLDDLPRTLCPVSADYVPVVDPPEVSVPDVLIRPYYLAWERMREQDYADRQRLSVAVLWDAANAARNAAAAK